MYFSWGPTDYEDPPHCNSARTVITTVFFSHYYRVAGPPKERKRWENVLLAHALNPARELHATPATLTEHPSLVSGTKFDRMTKHLSGFPGIGWPFKTAYRVCSVKDMQGQVVGIGLRALGL